MSDALNLLARRQSVPSRQLQAPGPDAATLQRLLQTAIRVPDHGKLAPWRLITAEGDAKLEMGRRLATLAARNNPDMPDAKRTKEQQRYTFAPLVIVVAARLDPDNRIPEQEQLLSAGCVAHNLLLGAQACGFGAQWLTGWAAYDREAAGILGLASDEHVVGFVHIGTPKLEVPERNRPAMDSIVNSWTP